MRFTFALVATLLVVALVAVAVRADKPPDTPCVTWKLWSTTKSITNLNNWYTAAYAELIGYTGRGCTSCTGKGYILPCFAADTNTWGHHDYVPNRFPFDNCRTQVNGKVHFSNSFYLPEKGTAVKTWKWQLTQSGAKVPDNAIRYGPSVMARSTSNAPGCCMGEGFTGWALGEHDGTFGKVFFAISDAPETYTSFAVAICKAYVPTPQPHTPEPFTPQPPTPKPTLPPPTKPYVRFAHALPSLNNLDAEVVQASSGRSHTWTNFKFGQFSNWVEVFEDGTGSITLWQNKGGQRVQPPLLKNVSIPLTPGPLIVAVKANLGLVNRGYWPPNQTTNVETIAASYVPSTNASDSGLRLFNLSPDTATAELYDGSQMIASGIRYTLGSRWAPLPVTSATFTVKDQSSGKTLAKATTTPPTPPFVFTAFLIGSQNFTGTTLGPRLLPLIDAPEK